MSKVEVWIWRVVLVGLIIFQFAVYFNIEAHRKSLVQINNFISQLAEFNLWQLNDDK